MTATYPDLKGKSIFITGGGSGIGAALTDGFLGQGAKVAFVQRSAATGFCDAMEKKHGQRPLFMPCDISDTDKLKGAIAAAAEAHGPVQVLVNNAANDVRHAAEDVDEEMWARNTGVNLKPYFFASQAAAAGMRENGGGAIINFSSISYIMGQAGYALYTMANGGITALTRSLAREYGGDGIRVNALAPGWVMTDKQVREHVKEGDVEAHLAKQCIKRTIQPEDIVGPTLFLASDTSAMMTGQMMAVDGGVVVTG